MCLVVGVFVVLVWGLVLGFCVMMSLGGVVVFLWFVMWGLDLCCMLICMFGCLGLFCCYVFG